MSKNKNVTVVVTNGQQRAVPALSDTLRSWLEERSGEWRATGDAAQVTEYTEENFKKIIQIFLRGGDIEDAGRVMQGYALTWMYSYSETGTAAFLAEHGYSEGTGRRLMADFGLFNSGLSLQQIRHLREIEFTKRPLVAKLVGEELPRLLDGHRVNGLTLDGAKSRSRRELEDELKELTARDEAIRKLNKQLEDANHRAEMAESDAKLARGQAADLPPWARAVRTEAACASETVLAAIDIAREAFFKALETPLETGMDKASRARHLTDAGFLMHTTIRTCAAKAASFAEEIVSHLGDVENVGEAPVLTESEIRNLEKRRREILATARADYGERELARANGKIDGFKKGRGRPRKSNRL